MVSDSIGFSPGTEFNGETAYDNSFTTPPGHPNVTFVAPTGDSHVFPYAGSYPAFSPNVVAVGGTTLYLNPDNSYQSEVAWNQPVTDGHQMGASKGGSGQFEPEAGLPKRGDAFRGDESFHSDQNPNPRMIPDVSIDANSIPARAWSLR